MVAEQSGLREFLRTSSGKTVGIFVVVLALGLAAYETWSFFAPDPIIAMASSPLFIDSETGKTFHVKLKEGMSFPVKSPYTGRLTGYKAELCYWTKDGKPKTEPDAVLMNDEIGKPGPTFCPVCGRLVVHRNPKASDDRTPPPTEAEYKAWRGQ